MINLNSVPETQTNASPYFSKKRSSSLYYTLGVISAIVSLIILPEIFGAAAIILGAYTWRLEVGENRNRGLLLIIFGIITMLVGIYYTAFYGLFNILP